MEFHKAGDKLIPFPIECKSGKLKSDNADKDRICTLNIMSVTIESGAIFYGKTRNRLNIEFDESLKEETFTLAQKFYKLVDSRETQKPEYSEKYGNCSFKG